jgi:hypothetical protein
MRKLLKGLQVLRDVRIARVALDLSSCMQLNQGFACKNRRGVAEQSANSSCFSTKPEGMQGTSLAANGAEAEKLLSALLR